MHAQGGHLTPTKPGVGQEQHDEPVIVATGVGELVDLPMAQEPFLRLLDAWQAHPAAGLTNPKRR